MLPILKEKDMAGLCSSARVNYVLKFALVIYSKCVPGVRSYWQKNILSQSFTLLIFVIHQYVKKNPVGDGAWVYFDPRYKQIIRHNSCLLFATVSNHLITSHAWLNNICHDRLRSDAFQHLVFVRSCVCVFLRDDCFVCRLKHCANLC